MFTDIDISFSLLPVAFFLAYWSRSKSENSLWYIAVYSLLFVAINGLLKVWKTPLLYDLWTFCEFWCFAAFFHSQLRSAFSKRLLRVTAVVFTVFILSFVIYTKSAGNILPLQNKRVIVDSIQIGVEMIMILPFCFYYLYERTRDTTTLFIYNTYQFWIVLGIFLYLAGSFFIYIFAATLSNEELVKYWVVTNLFSMLRSCLFSLAIFYHAKPPKNNRLISDFEVSYFN